MKSSPIGANTAYIVFRATIGIIFITHGIARLYYWSIPGFGEFLDSQGLMIGLPLAWAITIGEIVSGSLLAFGLWVRYCTIFHALVIIAGIFMVHLANGWFVVGHGTGGIEYSMLLLVSLFYIYAKTADS